MSDLTSVQVLKPFDLGGKIFKAGLAAIPIAKLESLVGKGLVAPVEAAVESLFTGSPLETQLLDILRPHADAETDSSAATTLIRLLGERDNFKSALDDVTSDLSAARDDYTKATQTIAQMHQAAVGGVQGPIRGVVEDVEDVFKRAEAAEARVAELMAQPESKPVEQSGVDATSVVETSAAVPPVETQPTTLPLTAEELTKVTDAGVAVALLTAGFDSRDKIVAATDDELRKVKGVGDVMLGKLRGWLASPTE